MKRIKIHITGLFCLLALWAMSGCEHDAAFTEQPGGGDVSSDKVQIEIFARAHLYSLPATRGVSDESTVGRTPWVLVFRGTGDGATFVEAVQAFELAGKRYVLLTRQPDDNWYQLLILANPPGKFYYGDALTEYELGAAGFAAKFIPGSTTLSDVCTNILTEPLPAPSLAILPYSGDGQTFPMSTLLEVERIDNTTRIENGDGSSLMLVRTTARMHIVNKASAFELRGITAVVNAPRQGQFHRIESTVDARPTNLTEYRYDAAYSSPIVTAEAVDGGQSTASHPIYLYESAIPNNTYLLIQGTYEGREYYYKMAIVDDDTRTMDVLRNHSYVFTITAAKGPGYDTVEDAKVSKPSNTALDYKLLIDDSNAYETMANNDFYLGVSNSVFITYASEEADYEVFKLVTDCRTDFPNSCSVTDNRGEVGDWSFRLVSPANGARIPIVEGSTPDPNITPVEARISNWLLWHEDYQYDENGVPRNNAYITLKLGNLEKRIRIRQRYAIPAAGMTIRYRPATDAPESYDMNYYCLSAYVEDGADQPKTWIKLRPSAGTIREDTEHITVDDGEIRFEVAANTETRSRSGTIYLTTIKDPGISPAGSTMQRIKINITQSGKTIAVD